MVPGLPFFYILLVESTLRSVVYFLTTDMKVKADLSKHLCKPTYLLNLKMINGKGGSLILLLLPHVWWIIVAAKGRIVEGFISFLKGKLPSLVTEIVRLN